MPHINYKQYYRRAEWKSKSRNRTDWSKITYTQRICVIRKLDDYRSDIYPPKTASLERRRQSIMLRRTRTSMFKLRRDLRRIFKRSTHQSRLTDVNIRCPNFQVIIPGQIKKDP